MRYRLDLYKIWTDHSLTCLPIPFLSLTFWTSSSAWSRCWQRADSWCQICHWRRSPSALSPPCRPRPPCRGPCARSCSPAGFAPHSPRPSAVCRRIAHSSQFWVICSWETRCCYCVYINARSVSDLFRLSAWVSWTAWYLLLGGPTVLSVLQVVSRLWLLPCWR